MNDWIPGQDVYRLHQDAQKNYFIEINLPRGNIEFKFTRGGWKSVELNADKGDLPNRKVDYRGGLQIESVTIAAWADLDGSKDKHLLDGSWVVYEYEHAGSVRLEFFDGKVKWKWLNNSNPEESARDAKLSEEEKLDAISYRSEKIGDQIYIINWYHEPSGTYITISFNFKEKQMCGSAILDAKSERTNTIFEKGIIKEYHLVEN